MYYLLQQHCLAWCNVFCIYTSHFSYLQLSPGILVSAQVSLHVIDVGYGQAMIIEMAEQDKSMCQLSNYS